MPDITDVVLDCCERQTAIFLQVGTVFPQHPVKAGRRDRNRGPTFDNALFLKPVRYLGQGDAIAALETAVSSTIAQERFFVLARDLINRNVLAAQPTTELVDEERLLPIRNLRISTMGEIFGIGLQITSQRTLDQGRRHRTVARSVSGRPGSGHGSWWSIDP
jgi:hypothetical protein